MQSSWGAHAPSRVPTGAFAGRSRGWQQSPKGESRMPRLFSARARKTAREGACAPHFRGAWAARSLRRGRLSSAARGTLCPPPTPHALWDEPTQCGARGAECGVMLRPRSPRCGKPPRPGCQPRRASGTIHRSERPRTACRVSRVSDGEGISGALPAIENELSRGTPPVASAVPVRAQDMVSGVKFLRSPVNLRSVGAGKQKSLFN